MLKRFYQLTCFLLLLFFSVYAWSAEKDAILPLHSQLRTGHLPNGVTYYIQPHAEKRAKNKDTLTVPRAELRLVLPIGSVQEEEGEEGAAHFIEHLMFRRTAHFDQHDLTHYLNSIGAQMGADVNAFTGFDQTVYMLNIPLNDPQNLDNGILLLSDWLNDATFDEGDVEEERHIIIEEWRRSLGKKMRIAKSFIQSVLEESRYAERLPIGKEATIRSLSYETLRDFYSKWYLHSPAAIIAVGDFDTDTVEELILKHFSMPRKNRTIPVHKVPEHQGTHFTLFTDNELNVPSLNIIFKQKPVSFKKVSDMRAALAYELLQSILEDRLNLLTDCSPQQFEHVSFSSYPLVKSAYIIELEATPRDKQVTEALEIMLTELKRLQLCGVTTTEMERAKLDFQAAIEDMAADHEQMKHHEIANNWVEHYLFGMPFSDASTTVRIINELLAQLTSEDITNAAKQLDYHHNCIILVALPASYEPVDESSLANVLLTVDQKQLTAHVDNARISPLLETLPAPGAIVDEAEISSMQATALLFSNGMRLCLKPTPFKESEVLLSTSAPGGLSDFTEQELPTARLAASLLSEAGVGGFSPLQLEQMLTGKSVYLRRFIDIYSRHLIGACSTKDVETLFQLVHLIFTRQVNPQGTFENNQQRAVERLSHELEDVNALFQQRCNAINTQNHYFFRPSQLENVQQIQYDEANAYALNFFTNPADFTFFLVGDFDTEVVKQLACTYLASIPQQGPGRTQHRKLDFTFPKGVVHEVVTLGTDPKSVVHFTLPLRLENSSPELMDAVGAANSILSGQLSNLLRTKLSGTYHVDSQLSFFIPELNEGYLNIHFTCDPEDASLLASMALREMRLLRSRGPTSDEVKQVIDSFLRNDSYELVQNAFWVTGMTLYTQVKWDINELARSPKRHKALSAALVKTALQNMLSLDNYSLVILQPHTAID